jgi:acetolactate synthase I/II/III large subunit
MIRLADYVAQTLAAHGVRHLFLVTGGGAMHLNDAFGRCEGLRYVCCHHEQACAMAAEGYARITNKIGVVNVTSGPGGINALNGVFGAWTDSIPMLVVSGQMKRETLLSTHGLTGKLRQLGDQEADIIQMVKGITKHAQLITDPSTIRYHLEKSLFLAAHGRPGPCWLDVPVDVQAAMVEPETMPAYDPAADTIQWDLAALRKQAAEVAQRLLAAKRPVILGGTGVRLAGAAELFRQLAERLNIPVTTAWTHDLIPSEHPLYCGRQGTIGTRPGNFTVQNSDCVLILGSRMCIRQVSYNWGSFARAAFKVQVDVDAAELTKPTFRADLPIQSDAKLFLELLLEQIPSAHTALPAHLEWLKWCRERLARYPGVLPKHRTAEPGTINQYHLVELLFAASQPGDIFVCGDASACITPFQAGLLKPGQRLFSNSGSASMGYDLPAAIGAALAAPEQRVICLAGDGSLQMNIQELATVAHHRLPIKLFVLCNGGYLSIRSTQNAFFKLLVGEGPESGVSFPDFVKVAEAYGLPARRLDPARAAEQIKEILNAPGPQVIAVELDRTQPFEPKLSSKRLPDGRMVTAPLEDMAPFLDRDEFRSNMLVPPVD